VDGVGSSCSDTDEFFVWLCLALGLPQAIFFMHAHYILN